jgi:hypothetical protein
VPVELASRLLSGPDLGGGFLFQLTRDGPPLPSGFTFHLQDAGTDAGERPMGSPELLGYRHPETPCMYGGRECWHLAFPLPEEALPRVRLAYNRTRFVVGPMLRQASGSAPAPIAEGMADLLGRIVPALGSAGVPWQVGGSAAAWLRGVPLRPKDIDLGVSPAGAAVLADVLGEYLVEPTRTVTVDAGAPRERAVAFVGTLRAGIRAEWWTARETLAPGGPAGEWEGPGWVERREFVEWGGHRVPVAPVEFELLRLAGRGDASRLATLVAAYRAWERPPRLLEEAMAVSNLAPEALGTLREALRGRDPSVDAQ